MRHWHEMEIRLAPLLLVPQTQRVEMTLLMQSPRLSRLRVGHATPIGTGIGIVLLFDCWRQWKADAGSRFILEVRAAPWPWINYHSNRNLILDLDWTPIVNLKVKGTTWSGSTPWSMEEWEINVVFVVVVVRKDPEGRPKDRQRETTSEQQTLLFGRVQVHTGYLTIEPIVS